MIETVKSQKQLCYVLAWGDKRTYKSDLLMLFDCGSTSGTYPHHLLSG